MDKIKKWLPAVIFISFGLIAVILGFVSAFGSRTLTYQGQELSTPIPDMFDEVVIGSSIYDGVYVSHVWMAYVGGMVTGFIGAISLVGGLFVIALTRNETFSNRLLLIISIALAVVIFALSIASIVCKTKLGDMDFLMAHSINI